MSDVISMAYFVGFSTSQKDCQNSDLLFIANRFVFEKSAALGRSNLLQIFHDPDLFFSELRFDVLESIRQAGFC